MHNVCLQNIYSKSPFFTSSCSLSVFYTLVLYLFRGNLREKMWMADNTVSKNPIKWRKNQDFSRFDLMNITVTSTIFLWRHKNRKIKSWNMYNLFFFFSFALFIVLVAQCMTSVVFIREFEVSADEHAFLDDLHLWWKVPPARLAWIVFPHISMIGIYAFHFYAQFSFIFKLDGFLCCLLSIFLTKIVAYVFHLSDKQFTNYKVYFANVPAGKKQSIHIVYIILYNPDHIDRLTVIGKYILTYVLFHWYLKNLTSILVYFFLFQFHIHNFCVLRNLRINW